MRADERTSPAKKRIIEKLNLLDAPFIISFSIRTISYRCVGEAEREYDRDLRRLLLSLLRLLLWLLLTYLSRPPPLLLHRLLLRLMLLRTRPKSLLLPKSLSLLNSLSRP